MIFHLLCCIIVIVSSVDIYWLSKNRFLYNTQTVLLNNVYIDSSEEKNPIGRYILELDRGDVSLFILLKIIGTYFVIAILYAFRHHNIGYPYVIAASVATAQLILLMYLYS